MPSGKILFVATVYTHLANFHLPFMKLLQKRGYDIHAAASAAEGRKADVEAAGVTCWEIPFARSPYSPANLRACRSLKQLFKAHCFDLIHVHTPVASFLGRRLARDTRQGPVLYTAHGFHFYQGAPLRNWLVYFTAELIAARWTDGLLVMNGEDLANARRLGFVEGKNLFYVHGVGVEPDRFPSGSIKGGAIRTELGIGAAATVVTCIAELTENKNHDFLLDAWKQLTKGCATAHLLLAGDGEMRDKLQHRVKREEIPRVHFLGFRRDVPRILAETDLFALVSKREGLPKSVMEAMAAGKPVIAADIRGSRDLVEHGRTGLLVEPGDVAGLAGALERLLADCRLRETLGDAGREKIQDYSLDRVLAEMTAVYDRYLIAD